jgi:hypothetical protein
LCKRVISTAYHHGQKNGELQATTHTSQTTRRQKQKQRPEKRNQPLKQNRKMNETNPEHASGKHRKKAQNRQAHATKGRTTERHLNRDQAQQKNGKKQKRKYPRHTPKKNRPDHPTDDLVYHKQYIKAILKAI